MLRTREPRANVSVGREGTASKYQPSRACSDVEPSSSVLGEGGEQREW